jgi:hypothetical protein
VRGRSPRWGIWITTVIRCLAPGSQLNVGSVTVLGGDGQELDRWGFVHTEMGVDEHVGAAAWSW